MATKKPSKPTSKSKNSTEYVPYSDWSKKTINKIKELTDECLDRFKIDKKLNTELLKQLSKLQRLVEDRYSK